jgi:hypothetical protein
VKDHNAIRPTVFLVATDDAGALVAGTLVLWALFRFTQIGLVRRAEYADVDPVEGA